jgi:hypothetical protein
MEAAVHNSELGQVVAGLVAGRMCGARNLGFGSVAGLVEELAAALKVGDTVAAQEV